MKPLKVILTIIFAVYSSKYLTAQTILKFGDSKVYEKYSYVSIVKADTNGGWLELKEKETGNKYLQEYSDLRPGAKKILLPTPEGMGKWYFDYCFEFNGNFYYKVTNPGKPIRKSILYKIDIESETVSPPIEIFDFSNTSKKIVSRCLTESTRSTSRKLMSFIYSEPTREDSTLKLQIKILNENLEPQWNIPLRVEGIKRKGADITHVHLSDDYVLIGIASPGKQIKSRRLNYYQGQKYTILKVYKNGSIVRKEMGSIHGELHNYRFYVEKNMVIAFGQYIDFERKTSGFLRQKLNLDNFEVLVDSSVKRLYSLPGYKNDFAEELKNVDFEYLKNLTEVASYENGKNSTVAIAYKKRKRVATVNSSTNDKSYSHTLEFGEMHIFTFDSVGNFIEYDYLDRYIPILNAPSPYPFWNYPFIAETNQGMKCFTVGYIENTKKKLLYTAKPQEVVLNISNKDDKPVPFNFNFDGWSLKYFMFIPISPEVYICYLKKDDVTILAHFTFDSP